MKSGSFVANLRASLSPRLGGRGKARASEFVMKFKTMISVGALCLLSFSEAHAQKTKYFGAPGSKGLVLQVAYNIQQIACGQITYPSNDSETIGEVQMGLGNQETAPMLQPLRPETCSDFPDAKQAVLARERMPVIVNHGSARGCDSRMVQDLPSYSGDVEPWAEALQLIYGGVNGTGTQSACSAPARSNLINNWGAIWGESCASGDCDALRFAFRPGDDNPLTKVFQKLVGIQSFCNGTQAQDEDPLRTDCSDAADIDWCPDGDLGVVQAVQLARNVGVYPRLGCVSGRMSFGFLVDGETSCPDNAAPVAGFLCIYPEDCRGRVGCINSYENPSVLDPLMDGRDYNRLQMNANYERTELPEGYSPSFVFLNGKCTGGNDGRNTESQIGCLVNQVKCSMAFGSKQLQRAPVTVNDPGPLCSAEQEADNQSSILGGKDIEGREQGYPLSRPFFLSSNKIPVVNGAFDCSQITDPEERALCSCMFRKNIMALAAVNAKFEIVSSVEFASCGAATL